MRCLPAQNLPDALRDETDTFLGEAQLAAVGRTCWREYVRHMRPGGRQLLALVSRDEDPRCGKPCALARSTRICVPWCTPKKLVIRHAAVGPHDGVHARLTVHATPFFVPRPAGSSKKNGGGRSMWTHGSWTRSSAMRAWSR